MIIIIIMIIGARIQINTLIWDMCMTNYALNYPVKMATPAFFSKIINTE